VQDITVRNSTKHIMKCRSDITDEYSLTQHLAVRAHFAEVADRQLTSTANI
jgi:hypothetical protein